MVGTLRSIVALMVTVSFAVCFRASTCQARGIRLMGEQSTGTGTAGNESVIYTYDTYADLLANNASDTALTQINWGGDYSTVGLIYDGTYRLMGEQDTATGTTGNESIIYTYNTFADLLANNSSSASFTQINWVAKYSTAALVYDGVYRLMGEQDTATGTAGNESIIYTYNTFADLLANNPSAIGATQIDWSDTYSTAGLAYDGVYRLMGERSTATGVAGNESVIYTYDTFADLLANNSSSNVFTRINWSAPFSTAGLAVEQVSRCDLNSDGAVDAADAGILFTRWGTSAQFGTGDITGDSVVDAADASVCFAEWTGDSAHAVPEPASLAAGMFLMASLFTRCRGRSPRQARLA